MELTGKLIVINETKEYGSNGFKKREFVIETENEKYPQKILIEVIQDKCNLLDNYSIGDSIKVSYNINGREWINPQGEAKYFNSVQGWRIENLAQAQLGNNIPTSEQFEPQQDFMGNDPNNLPF